MNILKPILKNLLYQTEQMQGLFNDEDGTIQEAINEAQEAIDELDELERKTQNKTYVCSHCKSENIWFDSIMAWNKEKQKFQLEDLGKAFCNDCQGVTTDEEITQ
jgi:hypothetical protein